MLALALILVFALADAAQVLRTVALVDSPRYAALRIALKQSIMHVERAHLGRDLQFDVQFVDAAVSMDQVGQSAAKPSVAFLEET